MPRVAKLEEQQGGLVANIGQLQQFQQQTEQRLSHMEGIRDAFKKDIDAVGGEVGSTRIIHTAYTEEMAKDLVNMKKDLGDAFGLHTQRVEELKIAAQEEFGKQQITSQNTKQEIETMKVAIDVEFAAQRDKIMRAGDWSKKIEEQMGAAWTWSEKIDRQMSEMKEMAARGDREGGWKGNGEGLVEKRDLRLTKLSEKPSKAEFKQWRECLDMKIENTPSWKGMRTVLDKLKVKTQKVTQEMMDELVKESNEQGGDLYEAINAHDFKITYSRRAKSLYTCILPNLNVRLATACASIRNQDGLEMYRRVSFEEDGTPDGTGFMIQSEITGMVKKTSGTIDEAKTAVDKLERKLMEYKLKTGKELGDQIKETVLWHILDHDTRRTIDVRIGEEDEGTIDERTGEPRPKRRTYERMKMEFEKECRKIMTDTMLRGGGNKMDVDGLEGREQGESPEGEGSEDQLHMDAFGKGKSKGKGLVCYNCGGAGHPSRLCPTKDNTATHKCHKCNGKGHFARDCTSGEQGKGKGKGTEQGWTGFKGLKGGKKGGSKGYPKGGKGIFGMTEGYVMGPWNQEGADEGNEPWINSVASESRGGWSSRGWSSQDGWNMPITSLDQSYMRSMASVQEKREERQETQEVARVTTPLQQISERGTTPRFSTPGKSWFWSWVKWAGHLGRRQDPRTPHQPFVTFKCFLFIVDGLGVIMVLWCERCFVLPFGLWSFFTPGNGAAKDLAKDLAPLFFLERNSNHPERGTSTQRQCKMLSTPPSPTTKQARLLQNSATTSKQPWLPSSRSSCSASPWCCASKPLASQEEADNEKALLDKTIEQFARFAVRRRHSRN